jgi:hypothetical protein
VLDYISLVSRQIPCNPGVHGIHRDTSEMTSRRDRDYDSSLLRTKNQNLDLATELKAFFKLIIFRILQEFEGSTFFKISRSFLKKKLIF